MKFARWVFTLAGIYGLLVLSPMYFLESRINAEFPPAITHPEYFYGFLGVALSCQIGFLLIGTDPIRFRPMMIAAILEKLGYGIAVIVLYIQGRTNGQVMAISSGDLILAVLFFAAYLRTPKSISL